MPQLPVTFHLNDDRRPAGRTTPPRVGDRFRSAFTLIELLVVIGIVGLLISVLLPALSGARRASQRVVCASNLRQVGTALQAYVSETRGYLPCVVEPFYRTVTTTGGVDWTADPTSLTDPTARFSLYNVFRRWLQDPRVMVCPAALDGYPRTNFRSTYRIAAANNGGPASFGVEPLLMPGDPSRARNTSYNSQYLNGRKHKLLYADPFNASAPYRITQGVGIYYVLRDIVVLDPSTMVLRKPHLGGKSMFNTTKYGSFNQLRIDFSVSNETSREADGFLNPP